MGKRSAASLNKKEAKIQIKQALASLTVLQSSLGAKKFERRLQKVEKILSNGLPKKAKKQIDHLKEADSAA